MLDSTSKKPAKLINLGFIGALISRRWIVSTIIVAVASVVMIRLGIWQLDRLEQRRTFNSRVLEQITQPAVILDEDFPVNKLLSMEYRDIIASGNFDHSQEIALLNQYEGDQWGVHLITPLLLADSNSAILIDRGWIPADSYQSGEWDDYSEPGFVQVKGVVRLSRNKADFGTRRDQLPGEAGSALKTWNFVNIELIQKQMPYTLLPIYIQQSPDLEMNEIPVRSSPELDLTEGPHLGYAVQWFIFAIILGCGYTLFISRHERI